ncbi:MAG: lipoate--protein ligase family protein [Nitrospirae bacterium]|nr:lipoate--protein ligase family protein [Nitrospirota bacterium]
MTEWRFIDSGPCAASYNMALDEALALTVQKGDPPPVLRLYGWERPSVSLGSFQKITDIDLDYCLSRAIPVVRRPTGGRAILHGDELTYSFSSRNEGSFSGGLLASYRQLSTAFVSALETLGLRVTMKEERETGRNLSRSPLCFRSTSYGEISHEGRKLVGSAQKRWKHGLLQQGSIPYSVDEEGTKRIFAHASSTQAEEAMTGLRDLLPGLDPAAFREAIKSSFEKTFRVTFRCSVPSPEEECLARELEAQRYLPRDRVLQA